ncbi:MAG: transcriptional regulator, family [Thermoleophilia bacterium]|nr:transcriptional regulator, family [Thermoleophilia bacterium]
MSSSRLGERLREVRELKGLSLASVAKPSEMSATYLQKLERGDVESPSPHRLYKLSTTLGVDYGDLMQLAGYVVPDTASRTDEESEVNVLAQALNAPEGLSGDEVQALAEYLAFIRQRKAR